MRGLQFLCGEDLFGGYLSRTSCGQEHLALSPLQLYLRLRLERARHLLRQTSMGVIEVGLACGFGSASAFSRAYRQHYATAPSADRKEGLRA